MESIRLFSASGFLVLSLMAPLSGGRGSRSCRFPAIYNFWDSNSDSGGYNAALADIPWPYGETFFKQPSGRASDGRLLIDFIAENLGLPYLSAYLDSIGTNFRHGVNFAVGGSCIQPACGYSPFNLGRGLSSVMTQKL